MVELHGPEQQAVNGKASKLVVFLHGYGSNGDDLISLAPYWADLLPDAAFISPHAPFPCEVNPLGGFQWFGFENRSPVMILGGVRAAATILDAFLDAALEAHGLDD